MKKKHHLEQKPTEYRTPKNILGEFIFIIIRKITSLFCVFSLNIRMNFIGFECLECVIFYEIETNLVIYFGSVLHINNASNTGNITIWYGTSYFTPTVGVVKVYSYLDNQT